MSLLTHHLRLRDVEVVVHLAESPLIAHANRIQLEQVFVNLLTNTRDALEASPVRRVTIRSGKLREHLEIRVQDTGPGIAAEVLPRSFDPFFTTKEVGKGTGQGLAISHAVVEKHGGAISFETEEGQGTTFIIRLPVSSAS